MGKIDREFPASAAVHGGLFHDRTLREFAERRIKDPDSGTPHEGTVHEIPDAIGDLWGAQMRQLQAESKWTATEETVAVALSGQRARKRRALRWFDTLPLKKQRELAEAFPQLKERVA